MKKLAVMAIVLAATPACAADQSQWSPSLQSRMRLIAAAGPSGGTPRAGVELALNDGWKTYWRYPGDSGVPPQFDFSRSYNVERVTVRWPAPHTFTDASGMSIGYKTGVVFPLDIKPRDPARPVTLRLQLDYAVCEKLCVPAQGEAELPLANVTAAHRSLLDAAEAAVPKPATAAEAGIAARRDFGQAKPRVSFDVARKGPDPIEVFAEGPAPQWSLPIPKAVAGAPAGRQRFEFELDGLPSGADPKGRYDLTLTIVQGRHAIEVTTHLD